MAINQQHAGRSLCTRVPGRWRRLLASESRLHTRASGGYWVLLLFTTVTILWLCREPPSLPQVRPGPAPVTCSIPVEVLGVGVRCLSALESERLELPAGSVWPLTALGERAVGPPTRMRPLQLLTLQVPLDPQTASEAELLALPEIGPQLAQRIVAARVRTPLRTRAALLQISGMGEHRLLRLLPYFVPLP